MLGSRRGTYHHNVPVASRLATCHTLPLQMTTIPEGGELMKHPQNIDMSSVMQGVEFEGIYNRDSMKYIDLYRIPDVHTLLRGTLRYKVSKYCSVPRII